MDKSCEQNQDPWRSHSVRITAVTREIPGVVTLDLEFEDPAQAAAWTFRPGQFTMLYVPGVGESAISISGDATDTGRIRQTIRDAGNVTHSLTGFPPGTTIGLRGPFGSSWPVDECHGRDVILVAGGIGLAPLRPVIYHMLHHRQQYQELTLIVGAREPALLLYPGEYEHWRTQGLNIMLTVDHADESWRGGVGVVTTVLERLSLHSPADTMLMTCGPEVMMWYTIQTALGRGIPAGSLFLSMERNMNCAIALCGHCQFGPYFLCREGPVFHFEQLRSILRIDDL